MPQKNKPELVDHPKHYNNHPSGLECIQFKRHLPSSLSDAFKYIWRYSLKGGIEDLQKSIWYINDDKNNRMHRPPNSIQPELISQLLKYEPNVIVASIFETIFTLSWACDSYSCTYDNLVDRVELLITATTTDKTDLLIKEISLLDPNIDHFDI